MSESESIYGPYRPVLEKVQSYLMDEISMVRQNVSRENGYDPVEHCPTRIKGEDSMREKCRRQNIPETGEGLYPACQAQRLPLLPSDSEDPHAGGTCK